MLPFSLTQSIDKMDDYYLYGRRRSQVKKEANARFGIWINNPQRKFFPLRLKMSIGISPIHSFTGIAHALCAKLSPTIKPFSSL